MSKCIFSMWQISLKVGRNFGSRQKSLKSSQNKPNSIHADVNQPLFKNWPLEKIGNWQIMSKKCPLCSNSPKFLKATPEPSREKKKYTFCLCIKVYYIKKVMILHRGIMVYYCHKSLLAIRATYYLVRFVPVVKAFLSLIAHNDIWWWMDLIRILARSTSITKTILFIWNILRHIILEKSKGLKFCFHWYTLENMTYALRLFHFC